MKRLFSVLILSSLLFSATVTADASALSLSADCALLTVADSGDIVYEKNASRRMSPASTTKIMTALVVLENADTDSIIRVNPSACGTEGSSVYLCANEPITVETLLYALLLESANDAAEALAYAVGGDIASFADMMNDKASEIGLSDTHFVNPHGLYDENHYTTAHDLAALARYALRNEKFAKIVSTEKVTYPKIEVVGYRIFRNHNKLLRLYDGVCGVKTGFTKKSGRCLVSAARRDGVDLVAVTLNAPDDWNDHISMYDYGFSLFRRVELCGAYEIECELPVVGGNRNTVECANNESRSYISQSAADKAEMRFEMPHFAYAPINKGAVLGYAAFYEGGKLVARVPLVAKDDIIRTQSYSIFERIFGKKTWTK